MNYEHEQVYKIEEAINYRVYKWQIYLNLHNTYWHGGDVYSVYTSLGIYMQPFVMKCNP